MRELFKALVNSEKWSFPAGVLVKDPEWKMKQTEIFYMRKTVLLLSSGEGRDLSLLNITSSAPRNSGRVLIWTHRLWQEFLPPLKSEAISRHQRHSSQMRKHFGPNASDPLTKPYICKQRRVSHSYLMITGLGFIPVKTIYVATISFLLALPLAGMWREPVVTGWCYLLAGSLVLAVDVTGVACGVRAPLEVYVLSLCQLPLARMLPTRFPKFPRPSQLPGHYKCPQTHMAKEEPCSQSPTASFPTLPEPGSFSLTVIIISISKITTVHILFIH